MYLKLTKYKKLFLYSSDLLELQHYNVRLQIQRQHNFGNGFFLNYS